ncbi:MAG: PEP-CTERM sorting domain-containing protein [Aulosira sp. ZfuVER01]|nr:PEP-CTERM sorting domain-containing protein [Aulosira sp. ZfuVER01]MDZ8002942.1 PEP-CTERM sorting domain-containing protein [Aulosira sp. DedVER01a]MDZ8053544.1 PEP-CTERM sorting domain-containing protein [Aulosira sp. ZfuCHP01]
MFNYLRSYFYLRNTKKILSRKAWIILGKFGLIAACDIIFVFTIAVYEASATRISLINPSESTCIKGKDACIKKISKDTLKEDEEIDTFLRIESLPETSTKEGYNTDASLIKSRDREKQRWSHSLKLSDVPIVNIGGTDYREFILTINEPEKTKANPNLPEIELKKLQIFLGKAPNLINYPTFDGHATKTFDLEQNSVLLQDINSEHGKHDYLVYISDSFFTKGNKGDKKYVYLFSQFTDAEGGIVEWAVRKLDKGAILPTIPAGGSAGAAEGILGSLIPFFGLSQVLGGGGSPSNHQNLIDGRTGVITPNLAKPSSEVPEPTTVLASLIGISFLATGRSKINSKFKIKKHS